MPIVDWNDSYSVKIKEVDDQHRQLIDQINMLHDAMKQRKGNEVVGTIIARLAEYTQRHFMTEEQLFSKHGYPDTARHTREHNAFIEKVAGFQKDLKAGRVMLSMEVLNFLKEWLIGHIQTVDKKYGPFLNAKGVV
ncbi:MAG: hemerythrin family protein [Desulfatitalea sp.]|nr:hemerythrin family protein [Desulfatitalea sp.]